MTLKELKDRVSVRRGSGYCSYIITITYYGKEYTCHSNNSLAWDRLTDAAYRSPRDNSGEGMTEKEAYQQLMWECKRANGLLWY